MTSEQRPIIKQEIITNTLLEESIKEVNELARRLFGDLVDFDAPIKGMGQDVIVANSFQEMLRDPSNTLVTLEEKGQVLGFTLSTPIDVVDMGREHESTQTAYGFFGGIEPSRQGEKLIGSLLQETVRTLADRGYSFVECDCTIYNGWADSFGKFYRKFDGAIVDERERSAWPGEDPYRFFRINLQRAISPIGSGE
jgi:predicted N-acetyltransferase YhbS